MCNACMLQGTAAVTRAASIMANGDTELKHLLTASLRLLPEHRKCETVNPMSLQLLNDLRPVLCVAVVCALEVDLICCSC
jgi:hypothetical protein